MKTLVVAQQKGGVGKTAALVHLAFDFFERGLRVAVLDLDTQENASFTLKDFASDWLASQMFLDTQSPFSKLPPQPGIHLLSSDPTLADLEGRSLNELVPAFRKNIKHLSTYGFDIVLVDTAPTLGTPLACALYAADGVFSPIELEAYSILGIEKMLTMIENIQDYNTSLQFLGMLPSKVDARNPRHLHHHKDLQITYPQLLLPFSIGLRSSIADALASCCPVWKIKKTSARKASQEMRAIAGYIYQKMELKS